MFQFAKKPQKVPEFLRSNIFWGGFFVLAVFGFLVFFSPLFHPPIAGGFFFSPDETSVFSRIWSFWLTGVHRAKKCVYIFSPRLTMQQGIKKVLGFFAETRSKLGRTRVPNPAQVGGLRRNMGIPQLSNCGVRHFIDICTRHTWHEVPAGGHGTQRFLAKPRYATFLRNDDIKWHFRW